MFKAIIYKVIITLAKFTKVLIEVYNETYEVCDELTKQFYSEVKKRKEQNKGRFISRCFDYIKTRFEKETGFEMSDREATNFANNFFRMAIQKGDIDELYNLKEKEN